jgi:hypothetical protein
MPSLNNVLALTIFVGFLALWFYALLRHALQRYEYRLLEDRIEIYWSKNLARKITRSELKSIRRPTVGDMDRLWWNTWAGARYANSLFAPRLIIETHSGLNVLDPRDPEPFISYFEETLRQRVAHSSNRV